MKPAFHKPSNPVTASPKEGMNYLLPRSPDAGRARVGRISYVNVAPVYYGLENGDRPDWMAIHAAPPSRLNAMLAANGLDISPVSSVAYARHQHRWRLLPNLSIACRGPVLSVLLVSRKPFADLDGRPILLTHESAAAAALLRLLFAEEGLAPSFAQGAVGRPSDLMKNARAGIEGALVIGDAAIKHDWRAVFPYVYDLSQVWWEKKGLPFVFAVWAVRADFARRDPERVASVIRILAESKRRGLDRIEAIITATSEKLGLPHGLCREYYRKLYYELDAPEIRGLSAFHDGLLRHGLIGRPVSPCFALEPPTRSDAAVDAA